MYVKEYMTRKLRIVSPEDPIYQAERRMAKYHIHRLPVVDAKKNLVGMITRSDILAALPSIADLTTTPQQKVHIVENPVSLIMQRDVVSVAPDDRITQVARLMAEKKIGGVPVLKKGKIVGILTSSDVYKALIQVLGVTGKQARHIYDYDQGNDTIRRALDELDQKGLTVQSIVTFRTKSDKKRKMMVWAVERTKKPPATRKSSRRAAVISVE